MCAAWNVEQPKSVADIRNDAQDVPGDGIRNAMRAYPGGDSIHRALSYSL